MKKRCAGHMAEGMRCGLDPDHSGDHDKPWRPWKRSNYVPAPHFFALNHACLAVNEALGSHGCYLVGSAIERRDYRDVDVRYIMADAAYDLMFRAGGGQYDPLWSLICLTWSRWLSAESGLMVDFQIQRQTAANAEHDGPRHPMGIFHAAKTAP